jgi:hypothetical protein
MAKLPRVTSVQFGSAASAGQIGVFGSLAAGNPQTTTSVATAQSLAQWLDGWYSAVVDGTSPCIEDDNAIAFVFSYMLCYLMQQGIPEWDSGTTYWTGSLVTGVDTGIVYVSLSDNNLNNAVSNTTHWKIQNQGLRNTSSNDAILLTDNVVRGNCSSSSFSETLPAIASTPVGFEVTIKNVGYTAGNTVTVLPTGADMIESALTSVVLNYNAASGIGDSVTLFCNGTTWDIL